MGANHLANALSMASDNTGKTPVAGAGKGLLEAPAADGIRILTVASSRARDAATRRGALSDANLEWFAL